MKRIMFLGAALHQTPIIKLAKKKGLFVITCDNRPDNIGHSFADVSYNVSTLDRDGILAVAKSEKIDGVVSYASDVSAPTAAYVAGELGLKTNPLKSIEILTDKELFRSFLQKNGFNTPRFKVYCSYEELCEKGFDFDFPVVIKPVDSSGSKGVNLYYGQSEELKKYVEEAIRFSSKGKFIVEEFVEKRGYQISGDAFSVNGELRFWCLGNEYCINDKRLKEYIPMGECWPSELDKDEEKQLLKEIQRLITLLNMGTSAYNIEAMFDKNGNVYIMELGPRNGGSLIPDLIDKMTGVNLMDYTLRAALGENCDDLKYKVSKGVWANYNIPSFKAGKLVGVEYDNSLVERIIETRLSYDVGEQIPEFLHYHSNAVGVLIMKFFDEEEMYSCLSKMTELVKVEVI